MEENEVLGSGSEESVSSESPSVAPETSQPEQSAQAAAPKPDETPFHEHPRFKELVEQKNRAIESTRSLELKLAQLEGKLSQTQTPAKQAEVDDLIEDLKKIDPRLASRLESFGKTSSTIEQLQAKLDSFEKSQQQTQQQAIVKESVAKINSWHEANKVSPAIRSAINAQIDVLYMSGKLNPQNLEEAYKTVYEPYKQYAEEIKRETLKGYAPAKAKDASVPTSQTKGVPAKAKAPELPKFKDREELRAHAVKEFVANQAAKRSASSV